MYSMCCPPTLWSVYNQHLASGTRALNWYIYRKTTALDAQTQLPKFHIGFFLFLHKESWSSHWGQKRHTLTASTGGCKQYLPGARSSFILRNSWVCQAWDICPAFSAPWHGTAQETMYERTVLHCHKGSGADWLFENQKEKNYHRTKIFKSKQDRIIWPFDLQHTCS